MTLDDIVEECNKQKPSDWPSFRQSNGNLIVPAICPQRGKNGNKMKDLIEALHIIEKYIGGCDRPFYCGEEVLHINIDPHIISPKDLKRLWELNFIVDEENEQMDGPALISFYYGDC